MPSSTPGSQIIAGSPKANADSTRRPSEWQGISEQLQLALAKEAMRHAAGIIASQAELFAAQFANATLQDRGAVDALKLFALLLRETSAECLAPAGNA
jgi:hypothetical protein